MDEAALNELVHELLAAGRLPRSAATQVTTGLGDASPCAVCGERIGRTHVMYSVQFAAQQLTLRMHFLCFLVWERLR